LHRFGFARRAQERGADGGEDGSGEDGGAASIAAAFCRRRDMVGRESAGQGREMVLPAIEKDRPIEAWIIDDTAFPKQGKHSVGVHHQYCGQLGKQANCQVAVSLSIANHAAGLPVTYQLYLPQAWTKDVQGGRRQACRSRSSSRPSRRSRWNRYAGRAKPACRAASH